MEEEERQRLHPIIEDHGGRQNGGGAGSGLSGAGQPPKRTVRIAGEDLESPTAKAKQASIRIHEARCKTKIKSHSIHGMTEGEEGNRPHKEMGILTYEEKKFLLAVERGDVASVRRILDEQKEKRVEPIPGMLSSPASASGLLNINCCDPLGRSALLMAIDNENLEMVELLLDNKDVDFSLDMYYKCCNFKSNSTEVNRRGFWSQF